MTYKVQHHTFLIAGQHLININQLLYFAYEQKEKRKRSWLMTNLILHLMFLSQIFVQLPVDVVSLLYQITTSKYGDSSLSSVQKKWLHCSFHSKSYKAKKKNIEKEVPIPWLLPSHLISCKTQPLEGES